MRRAHPFGLVAVLALLVAAVGVPLAGADVAPPSLSVEVTDDGGGMVEVGGTAHLTITVTNSGESTVTAIRVEDTRCGLVGEIAVLAPGDSSALQAQFVALDPGQAAGTCTATGVGPAGEAVVASVQHALEVFVGDDFADFGVAKQALVDRMVPGGSVRYRITITNTHGDRVDQDAPRVLVSDDFDESKAVVLDAGGGKISGGRLSWAVDAPGPEDPPVVIEYALRARDDASGALVNRVRIDNALDPDPDNDTDSVTLLADVSAEPAVAATPEVKGTSAASDPGSSGSEPFLPFTGADDVVRTSWAILFAVAGMALHAWSRRSEVV